MLLLVYYTGRWLHEQLTLELVGKSYLNTKILTVAASLEPKCSMLSLCLTTPNTEYVLFTWLYKPQHEYLGRLLVPKMGKYITYTQT